MHHIVDGRTGASADDVRATWVLADTGLLADGLATALFFVDPSVLQERFDFDWVRVLASGEIQHSPSFEGEIFR